MYFDQTDLPGGDDFVDVTAIFAGAAQQLDATDMVFADGYTLNDAMSALEIGEPRMDSGMVLEEAQRPPFDPLAPLLPEEVCWILDRSISCEIAWHTGSTLSQTVYTFLYGHAVAEMHTDYLLDFEGDPSRPVELVTLVLRAAALAVMKRCNTAWVGLAKGGIHDLEDWHSEKADISLHEGTPIGRVFGELDQAESWLSCTTRVPQEWRDPLLLRVSFHKILLEIFSLSLPREREILESKRKDAVSLLERIELQPSPEPPTDSVARMAFDPYITRRLFAFMPLRVLELPPQDRTWKVLGSFFSGLEELYKLTGVTNVTTWQIVGDIKVWKHVRDHQLTYVRAIHMSSFINGTTVLGVYPLRWLVDRFFLESIGLSYDSVIDNISSSWIGDVGPPLPRFENLIVKLMKETISSSWYNPPRRRRYLMKSISEWHALQDGFVRLLEQSRFSCAENPQLLRLLPHIPLMWRLTAAENTILSGFQLELYSAQERTFAYWYLSQVIETHLGCIEDVLAVFPSGTIEYHEMRFRHTFLTGLQALATGMTVSLVKKGVGLKSEENVEDPNFLKRYKWALKPHHPAIHIQDVLVPNERDFINDCRAFQAVESHLTDNWGFAHTVLAGLQSQEKPAWSQMAIRCREELLELLIQKCQVYKDAPETFKFSWGPSSFPQIATDSN